MLQKKKYCGYYYTPIEKLAHPIISMFFQKKSDNTIHLSKCMIDNLHEYIKQSYMNSIKYLVYKVHLTT